MRKYRRSRYLLFTLEDLAATSGGQVCVWVATALLSGQHLLLSPEQLEQLRQVSSESWMSGDELFALGFTAERLDELVHLAILLTDDPPVECETYLHREEILESTQWPPMAAAFHLLNLYRESRNSPFSRISDTTNAELEAENRANRFLEANGPPPPAQFVHPTASEPVALPLEPFSGVIAGPLLRRRTCRHFSSGEPLARTELASLLRLTFGPIGRRRLAGKFELLLKTSPSGGSLHPIESFPLLLRCQGLTSGLYHYRSDQHGLASMRAMSEEEARRLAIYFAQGQSYAGACSAVIILVARFDRNFWKYRQRENSYSVVLQDAGHLSQTFQLVATDLGLGSFYTAAINGEALNEFIGLRYPAESALGMLGVGKPGEPPPVTAGIEKFDLQAQKG